MVAVRQTLPIDFSSGDVFVETVYNGEIIDCVSKIIEVNTKTNVAGGRTYTKGYTVILSPATYEVTVTALGVNKGLGSQTKTITVERGSNQKT